MTTTAKTKNYIKEQQQILDQVAQLKQSLCNELHSYEPELTENKALQIGLNLEVSFRTVQRYCSGDVKEVRRVSLAQDILNELKKLN